MQQEKEPKKNMWMLALMIALCVGWLLSDTIGLDMRPVFTAVILLACVILLLAYMFTNYRRR